MDFGSRLKDLRLRRGYTQQELCKKVGVSVVALRNWERGLKKPAMDAIISLGTALSVSIDELLDFSPANSGQNLSLVLSPAERRLLSDFKILDRHGKAVVTTLCRLEADRCRVEREAKPGSVLVFQDAKVSERYIPRYSTPSAAGISVPLDGDDFDMLLVDDSVPADADYAVFIQGSSMEPYIHDGDMVFVKKDEELSVGDVGIFSVDGAMYCKQYYLDDEGNLILVSANPELRNTNVVVNADSSRSVKACGKVLLDMRIGLPDYLFED